MCNAGVFTLTFNTLFAKTILFFLEGFGGYIILMEFLGRGGGGGRVISLFKNWKF